MIVSTEFELKLVDAPVPSGEVAAKDLAALAASLQELTTRIGRDVAGSAGPGRSKQHTEKSARLRLRSVTPGSTVLKFVKGPTDKLDIDLAHERLADDRFWDVIAGIGQNHKPEWMTDLVAESAGKLVAALRSAAPRAVFSAPARPTIDFDPTTVSVESWLSQGRVVSLDNAAVHEVVDPGAPYIGPYVVSVNEILASAPGADMDGGLSLTDEEFDEFLRAARS
ncbi:hypothetical protein ACXDF8_14125 [Mycolicibacterium sp. CBM1]